MTSAPGGKPEIRIGDWLKEGWEIIRPNIGTFILASLIYNLIIFTCVGGLLLYGPLTCGFYLMAFDRIRGGNTELKRLFAGFEFFGQSFFAGFLFFLLAFISASLASAFIGIVLMILIQMVFLFTFQIIADRKNSSLDAISKSFDKVKENFWEFSLFAVVLIVINLGGYFLVLGWLITTPFAIATAAAAYRDIFGLSLITPDQDVT
jgi:hypothetical protein